MSHLCSVKMVWGLLKDFLACLLFLVEGRGLAPLLANGIQAADNDISEGQNPPACQATFPLDMGAGDRASRHSETVTWWCSGQSHKAREHRSQKTFQRRRLKLTHKTTKQENTIAASSYGHWEEVKHFVNSGLMYWNSFPLLSHNFQKKIGRPQIWLLSVGLDHESKSQRYPIHTHASQKNCLNLPSQLSKASYSICNRQSLSYLPAFPNDA